MLEAICLYRRSMHTHIDIELTVGGIHVCVIYTSTNTCIEIPCRKANFSYLIKFLSFSITMQKSKLQI